MKNQLKTFTYILATFLLATTGLSHIYGLSNLTTEDIQVRVKLGGFSEPYYVFGPKPFETKENYSNFTPADRTQTLYFVAEDPAMIAGESVKNPLDYSRKFGFCLAPASFQYRKYEKGGDSAWMPLGIQFIEKPEYLDAIVNAAKLLSEGLKDSAAAVLKAIPNEKTKAAGEGLSGINLGAIIDGVSTLIEYSMCRERNFYFIDTENGKHLITNAE